jgi:hypothetical protein
MMAEAASSEASVEAAVSEPAEARVSETAIEPSGVVEASEAAGRHTPAVEGCPSHAAHSAEMATSEVAATPHAAAAKVATTTEMATASHAASAPAHASVGGH